MNVLEQMMMQGLSHAVQHHSDPIDAASILAAKETLELAAKINPDKVHGIIVIAVEACEPNNDGDPGISLTCSMAGAPAVLTGLAETSRLMLRATELKEEMARHPLGAILNEVMAGGSMVSEKAHERFSSDGKTQQ